MPPARIGFVLSNRLGERAEGGGEGDRGQGEAQGQKEQRGGVAQGRLHDDESRSPDEADADQSEFGARAGKRWGIWPADYCSGSRSAGRGATVR